MRLRSDPRNPSTSQTAVELVWIERRLEHWIRFGHPVSETILTRRTRILQFASGSIFALVRWTANDFGTVHSRIDIARAVSAAEPFTSLPFVRPGAEIFLSIHGWPKVNQVLQVIDAVEANGIDPADVAPDYWRHVHNRLSVGMRPRSYSTLRHRAFALRREIGR